MRRLERRLIGQAFSAWHTLCGDRPYPRLRDVEAACTGALLENSFVIDTSGGPEAYAVTRCGSELAQGLRLDLTGRRIDTLPDEHADQIIDFCRVVVNVGKPVANSDVFLSYHGSEMLYRAILLPLSSDGHAVDALLGAASFKRRDLVQPRTCSH